MVEGGEADQNTLEGLEGKRVMIPDFLTEYSWDILRIGLPLLHLLFYGHDIKASDSRDHVFALLGRVKNVN